MAWGNVYGVTIIKQDMKYFIMCTLVYNMKFFIMSTHNKAEYEIVYNVYYVKLY